MDCKMSRLQAQIFSPGSFSYVQPITRGFERYVPVQQQAGLLAYRSTQSAVFPVSQWHKRLCSLNTVTSSYRIHTCFPFHRAKVHHTLPGTCCLLIQLGCIISYYGKKSNSYQQVYFQSNRKELDGTDRINPLIFNHQNHRFPIRHNRPVHDALWHAYAFILAQLKSALLRLKNNGSLQHKENFVILFMLMHVIFSLENSKS